MAGLQLYGGLNVPEWFITGLQADTREQSQAASAWCIFNPFVPACMVRQREQRRETEGKAASPIPPAMSTDSLRLLGKWLGWSICLAGNMSPNP